MYLPHGWWDVNGCKAASGNRTRRPSGLNIVLSSNVGDDDNEFGNTTHRSMLTPLKLHFLKLFYQLKCVKH